MDHALSHDSEVKRLDGAGRINLGKQKANETYAVEERPDGSILLTPVAIIPRRELWLWENKTALASVKRGLQQSAEGKTGDLGSFAQFADDEG